MNSSTVFVLSGGGGGVAVVAVVAAVAMRGGGGVDDDDGADGGGGVAALSALRGNRWACVVRTRFSAVLSGRCVVGLRTPGFSWYRSRSSSAASASRSLAPELGAMRTRSSSLSSAPTREGVTFFFD